MSFSRGMFGLMAAALILAVLAWPREAPLAQPPTVSSASSRANFSADQNPAGPIPQAQGQPQQAPPPPAPTAPLPQPAPAAPVKSPTQQTPPGKTPQYNISVESSLVKVDVVVTDQDGNLLTGLTKDNFRVTEDNNPQQVTNFTPTDAPITIVMLMEFSRNGWISYQGVQWSYPFLNELKPQDWVALITYDLNTHIEVDFTQDKDDIENGLRRQMIPSFAESVMFDALIETLNRLQDVQGKKSILLIGSGFDTFSKHTLDQAYKRVKQSDVTIFCVGMSEDAEEQNEMQGQSGTARIGYYQTKNELNTFAQMTGGYAWFPRFGGEMPSIFHSVAEMLRHQYTLGFIPAGNTSDGKYHKIKVQVVDKNGQPLMIANKKGKMQKAVVYARQGYQAPSGTVGD
jgi:VWFA-related protein